MPWLASHSAWAAGAGVAGLVMERVSLATPLVLGASIKIAYDLLLWIGFRRLKPPEEVAGFVRRAAGTRGIVVDGLMGVAPAGEPARPHFARLRALLEDLRAAGLPNAPLREMSAGMSEDFEDAIREGATMVRIGRSLFGR